MEPLIKAIEKYITLTEEDKKVIEQLFDRKVLKTGECLLNTGQVCREFSFIETGLMRHYVNNDGVDETYYFSSENDFVCDYESFINRIVSNKTLEAIEDTILYTITFDHLQLFYRDVKQGERFGRLFLERVFTKAIKHIMSTHTDSAEQRYLNFLEQYKQLLPRIPQYYIASYIGVTPQSLSRIRRQMILKD